MMTTRLLQYCILIEQLAAVIIYGPHSVWTGFFMAKRQMGHSWRELGFIAGYTAAAPARIFSKWAVPVTIHFQLQNANKICGMPRNIYLRVIPVPHILRI